MQSNAELNGLKKADLVTLVESLQSELSQAKGKQDSNVLTIDKETKISLERIQGTIQAIQSRAGNIRKQHADKLPKLRELDGSNVRTFTAKALPLLKGHVKPEVIKELRGLNQLVSGLETLGLI